MTSRRWSWTNFCELGWRIPEDERIKCCIYQIEQTKDGKVHAQGYFELKNPMRMAGAKKLVGASAHMAISNGDREANVRYCSKEESRLEGPIRFGDWTLVQGKRTDLESTINILKEHGRDAAIMHSNGKFSREIDRVDAVLSKNFDRGEQIIFYIHGPTGVGKSRWVYEQIKGKRFYMWNNSKWWDGYDGEEIIWVDDFRWMMDEQYYLKVFDRYPCTVETKGGHVQLKTKTWYVTSNIDCNSVCRSNPAMIRRLGANIMKIEEPLHVTEVTEGNTGTSVTDDSGDDMLEKALIRGFSDEMDNIDDY